MIDASRSSAGAPAQPRIVQPPIAYRRDIDGLRAIAVLSVVIFHIMHTRLPGGFAGVDVFFVISGYLIGAHILEEASQGKFRLGRFYVKRIRRIFPAYAALMLVVTGVVLARLFPAEAVGYAKSMLAAVFSVSNIWFYASMDYFDAAAEQFPLLHSWSLAVEEQFYLIFPLLMLALLRFARSRLDIIILLLFAASLLVSSVAAFVYPMAAFYLLPMRAWELLLGTIVARGILPQLQQGWKAELFAALGLAMVLLSFVIFSRTTPWPGVAALLPCVGTALLIHAGRHAETRVSKLLSLRPVVFVGLISYSLYLWHWPILTFQRLDNLFIETSSRATESAVIFGLSLIAATLSWALVERLTRNPGITSNRVLLTGSAVAAGALALVAVLTISFQGFPGRFAPETVRVAAYLDYDRSGMREGQCFLTMRNQFSDFDAKACLPDLPGRRTYLLIGDSHGAAMAKGLAQVFTDANLLQVTAAACQPVLGKQQNSNYAGCRDLMAWGLTRLTASRHIDAVWLVGRWQTKTDAEQVAETVAYLRRRGLPVVVVGPNPEYDLALPRLIAKAGNRSPTSGPDQYLTDIPFQADALFKARSRIDGFDYLSPIDALCKARSCRFDAGEGVPTVFDTNHLTVHAAAGIGRQYRSLLERPPSGAAR